MKRARGMPDPVQSPTKNSALYSVARSVASGCSELKRRSRVNTPAMDRAKAPVFVLGSPRSGTTFLYHTLLSSGNFAVYQAESDVFNKIAPAFGNLRSLANRTRLIDTWLQSDYFLRTGLKAANIRAELLSECTNAGDFLRIVMERIAQQQ